MDFCEEWVPANSALASMTTTTLRVCGLLRATCPGSWLWTLASGLGGSLANRAGIKSTELSNFMDSWQSTHATRPWTLARGGRISASCDSTRLQRAELNPGSYAHRNSGLLRGECGLLRESLTPNQ